MYHLLVEKPFLRYKIKCDVYRAIDRRPSIARYSIQQYSRAVDIRFGVIRLVVRACQYSNILNAVTPRMLGRR